MDGEAWWAAVHGVAKSRTQLSNFTFTFHFPALEKEMATLSSVLAWRIPGMGEPGGLPSMGSHRVGHDWSDLAAAAANTDSHLSPPDSNIVRQWDWEFNFLSWGLFCMPFKDHALRNVSWGNDAKEVSHRFHSLVSMLIHTHTYTHRHTHAHTHTYPKTNFYRPQIVSPKLLRAVIVVATHFGKQTHSEGQCR